MLLATGLVENPGRTHVIAAQGLLEDLRDGVLAVLDKDDPGELETHGRTKAYFDELSKDPDYVTPQNFLKPLLGDESMAEYMMLHAAARQMLLDRWPKSEMDTVMGSVSMPPDEESGFSRRIPSRIPIGFPRTWPRRRFYRNAWRCSLRRSPKRMTGSF
jgi:hypothetical protein